jgi:hypothetical protein
MRARAKAAFPQFANQIDAGMTIRDIADPYISTYAQTLEVPETQVTLKDSGDPEGAERRPGRTGRRRPRCRCGSSSASSRTTRATTRPSRRRTTRSPRSNKIGKDFGFVGASA